MKNLGVEVKSTSKSEVSSFVSSGADGVSESTDTVSESTDTVSESTSLHEQVCYYEIRQCSSHIPYARKLITYAAGVNVHLQIEGGT